MMFGNNGDWGETSTQLTPNREIGFGFVSCSCRACERAGEAKLCGRVREQCFPTLVPRMVRCSAAPAVLWGFRFCCYAHGFFDRLSFFDAMLIGFLICFRFCCYAHGFFYVFVHLLCFHCYAYGFLLFFCVSCCYVHCFFMCFYTLFVFDAIIMGLFHIFVFLLVCSLAFWCFVHLFRFRCYAHRFVFVFCVFAGMLMGFLMCLPLARFAAMFMGFLILSCFCWYTHGFFDVFAHLVRFSCYAPQLVK